MTTFRNPEIRSKAQPAGLVILLLLFCAIAMASATHAQTVADPAPTQSAARQPAKARALIDITGYWVSIVNEDWAYRMMTPAKGDYAAVPLNPEGQRITDAWDPAKDHAEGNDCKAYGAGNIMRIPEHLHIFWADDNTLEMDTDAGMQKRFFHFDGSKWQGGDPQLQGDSVATWFKEPQMRAGGIVRGPGAGTGGSLHVVTSHLKPGYLQKNGIPYSGNAVINEYYNLIDLHGMGYLILTSVVTDPTYLRQPYTLSTQFKKEPDGSKWDPSPCRPTWPLSLRESTSPKRNPTGPAE
jgi:hypothetical protein